VRSDCGDEGPSERANSADQPAGRPSERALVTVVQYRVLHPEASALCDFGLFEFGVVSL
jgi:hypothetical protein